jgi:hypothetical protein
MFICRLFVKRKRVIEKYKLSNLSLVKSVRVELEANGNDLALEDQFMFGDYPVLYSSYYDKKERINYSYAQIVNPSSLSLSKLVPISKVEVEKQKGLLGGMMTRSLGDNAASSFYLSDDLELGLIVDAVDGDDEEKYSKEYKFKLFDNKLDLITENKVELPYDNFSVRRIKVGDDGLVYFVGARMNTEVDDSRLIKRDVQVAENLEILVIDIESGDIESLDIILKDERFVTSFAIAIDDKGSIILSGLSNKGSGVTGAFYSKFDNNLREVVAGNYDFEDDFITTTWSDRAKKKLDKKKKKANKKGEDASPNFYRYKLRDLIVKDDNSSTLLAEQYYVRVVTTTHTNANGGTYTTTTYYYYYNDVIAINFDQTGEIEWKTIVEKNQVSVNDGGYYSSFFTVTNENEINIIYNDTEASASDTDEAGFMDKRKMKKNIVGVKVKLDADGNQTKEILFEFEENGLRLVPKICGQANDNLVFTYARSKKGDKLGIIKL